MKVRNRGNKISTVCVPDEQFRTASLDHHKTISSSLAGRAVFQMDQVKSVDQIFFRHIGERGQNSDLDCSFRLCAGGNHQKTTQNQLVFDPTNFVYYCFRNYTHKSIAHRMRPEHELRQNC